MGDPASGELFDFLADLEARAGALHHRERSEEVDDRSRSAYADVTLESRLMASCGREVACEVLTLGSVRGHLERVGSGWFRVGAGQRRWLVTTASLVAARGLSPRSVPREAWPATDRLSVLAPLRRLASDGVPVVLYLVDGSRREGRLGRVGADFVELHGPDRGRVPTGGVGPVAGGEASDLVVTAMLVAVRSDEG